MATMITSECINCGACEPECPNTAIYQGGVEWQAPAPPKVAAPAPPTRGRVEKPAAPPPKARRAPTFAGELPIEYDQLVAELGAPHRRLHSPAALLPLGLLAAGQGFLGALSPAMK